MFDTNVDVGDITSEFGDTIRITGPCHIFALEPNDEIDLDINEEAAFMNCGTVTVCIVRKIEPCLDYSSDKLEDR